MKTVFEMSAYDKKERESLRCINSINDFGNFHKIIPSSLCFSGKKGSETDLTFVYCKMFPARHKEI